MEHFDERTPNRMREKNVYLLHLDAPRIIIISCVLIGVLIIAFLVGMNYSTDDRQDTRSLARSEMLFNPLPDETAGERNPLSGMEPSAEQDTTATSPGEIAGKNEVPPVVPGGESPGNAIATNQKTTVDPPSRESADILTNENIKEIIPPAKTVVRNKSIAKSSTGKSTKSVQSVREPRQKSHKTVEVVSRSEKTESRSRGEYSIQVCAFDNRIRAETEISNLKRHRYDPYMETTTVQGKRFYRVRVGPISSRSEAVKVLDEIKSMNKYDASFMIRE